MSSRRVPGRTLRRRFTLGSGPLKRTSDRVEVLSRVVLVLSLLLAVPLGLLAGAVTYTGVAATAQQQADTRTPETATLLADARGAAADVSVPTSATWVSTDGEPRTGPVDAAPGARAGSTVDIWIDGTGRVTDRPLTHGEVVGQAVVVGVLVGLGALIAGMSGHLITLWVLERRRYRRWEAGWATVEPLWVSRFR